MSIGKKIAEARKEKNLTQEQLADLMSVTRQSVSRWESDLAYPETEKIILLSELLGVSCDDLLSDSRESLPTGASRNTVTRLLFGLKGKSVILTLYESDYDIGDRPCVITDFDGPWMSVEYRKGRDTLTKILPVSSLSSVKIVKERK